MNSSIKRLYDSDSGMEKERFFKMATYIFFVYDKRSIYTSMSLEDRQRLVSNDHVEDSEYWKSVEENIVFKEIVDKLNQIQFNHKERLLEGVKKKIDDYLNVFNGLTLTEKTQKDHMAMAKGSQDLLELYDKLEQMVSKEALSKQVGGGTTKMFEDG